MFFVAGNFSIRLGTAINIFAAGLPLLDNNATAREKNGRQKCGH